MPNGYVRESGLSFLLADVFQQLTWKRKGYWDCYPADALAGNEGMAPLYATEVPAYGEQPQQPWVLDTHNYYYWSDAGADCLRPLTQMAKGMKENIYYYTLSAAGQPDGLTVLSAQASVACRLHKNAQDQLYLRVNNRWDYPEIAWGNYCKKLEALPCYGSVTIQLN